MVASAFIAAMMSADLSRSPENDMYMVQRGKDFIKDYFVIDGDETHKSNILWQEMMEDYLKRDSVDLLGWLTIGRIYATNGLADFSSNCYYIAHLRDHQKIKANSQLQFETYAQQAAVSAKDNENIIENFMKTIIDE